MSDNHAGLLPAQRAQTMAAGESAAERNGKPVRVPPRTGDGSAANLEIDLGLTEPDSLAGMTSLEQVFEAAFAELQAPPPEAPAPEAKSPEQELVVEAEEAEPELPETGEPEQVVEEAPPAEEPEKESPEAEEESQETPEEEPVKAPDALAKRQRIPVETDLEAMTLSIKRAAKKRGERIEFSEAERRAKVALGIPDKPAEAVSESFALPPGVPEDLAAVDERLNSLAQELKQAIADVEIGKAEELLEEQEKLRAARPQLEQVHAKRQEAANAAWNAQLRRAQELYPDANNETSALYQEAERILASAVPGSYFDDPLHAVVAAADRLRIPPGAPPKTRPAPPKPTHPAAASPSPVSAKRGPNPMPAKASSDPAAAASASLDEVFKDLIENRSGFTLG